MIDRAVFSQYVRQALVHLDDPVYLNGHPLAELLIDPRGSAAGPLLRERILDAIDLVRPPAGIPETSSAWRCYRYLVLRFVQGLDGEEVARALSVSSRQARRDYHRAVEAVTDILWRGYLRRIQPLEPSHLDVEPDSLPLPPLLEDEIESIGAAPATEPLNLAATLNSVLETVGPLARAESVRFNVEVPMDLPLIAVNRAVLRQVFIGLLSYVISLGKGTRLGIAAVERGDSVSITLTCVTRDRPTGEWPPRADQHARLAAIRRLVELQGGRFSSHVPRGGELHLEVQVPIAEQTTVLVVDDNPDFIRLFRRYVRSFPYRVIEANLESEALRLAREARPDLITLDVMMPTQDGWEILQRLKSDPETRGIPVVVCSVLGDEPLARSLGAAEFLSKPVTQRELLAVLDRWRRLAPSGRAR
ncbi:MAG: response regulator [Chloroflexi bacterium]|nr:response regulator [Chloroflexota bacterium]